MIKPIAPEVVALRADMFAKQLRLGVVLREAKVNPSTWTRWTKGADPKASTLSAMRGAIERLCE